MSTDSKSGSRLRNLIAASLAVLAVHAHSSAAPPGPGEAAPAGWLAQVQQDLSEKEYEVSWQRTPGLEGADEAWQAPNRAHGFRTWFTSGGIRVVPREEAATSWRWGLSLTGHGRGDENEDVPGAILSPSGRRIEYRRGALEEAYENTPAGLRQSFTLAAPPASGKRSDSGDAIHLDLALWGDLSPRVSTDGQAIDFVASSGAPILRYGQLKARSASGEKLPARMEAVSDSGTADIRLVVDARAAAWPITIEAVATSPAWFVQSDQPTSRFGATVATAGDVNGDGYSDVIVAAPLYDRGETDEGRAFLYLGSPSGPSLTHVWSAEGNVTNVQYGRAVASAGDVNADGYADVIVGVISHTLTPAGEVRLYLGSASGLPLSASWTTVTFDGTGFGASLARAGDVNGDGYDDIVVGDPDHGSTTAAQVGKFYVFLGRSSAGMGFPVLEVEGTVAMERLGHSVSTAGDVNGDGYADIVVSGYGYWEAPTGTPTTFGRVRVHLGSATGLSPTPAWTTIGQQALGGYGSSVSTAGDVDGDGYADILVGAEACSMGVSSAGRVYGYRGSASGLSTSPSWTLQSSDVAPSCFGKSVATAGDVNGDGFADIIVGAHLAANGAVTGGKAFVYQGTALGPAADPAWIAAGTSGSQLGFSVATAGDVNGDGYSDVVVGAPNAAQASIYLGSGAGPRDVLTWEVTGTAQEGLGWSVASAGDVNGDGFSDVIIGSPAYDNTQVDAGRALVYLGSASGLSTSAAWTREGDGTGGCLGVSVASAGDVNGDGYSDVIVGASGFGPESAFVVGPGHAEVYLGSASGLAATAAWYVSGDQFGGRYGESVASAGDVNGDGYSDVLVGARDVTNGQAREGRAYLYLGSPLGLATSPAWTAEGDLASAHFGASVASAGDVDRDGYSDVVIGAFGYDDGVTIGGRVSLYLGSASGLAAAPSWTSGGFLAGEWFGYSVATAGDFNGDGYSDVVVGSPFFQNTGRVTLYLGTAAGTLTFRSYAGTFGELYGLSVGPAGDVNGDGYADVAAMNSLSAHILFGQGAGGGINLGHLNLGMGDSIATAGDVNGDGFSDVITGFSYGGVGEGVARIFYGNGGPGLHRVPRQTRTDGTTPLAPLGRSDSGTSMRLEMRGLTPAGRGKVRLQWEVKPLGVPFDDSGVGVSTLQDTGAPDGSGSAASFNESITDLVEGTAHRWRARTVSADPFFPRSRWISIQGGNITETKFRTPICIDLDSDGYGAVGDPYCQNPAPDCDDSSSGVWASPGEVLNLQFMTSTSLVWDPPASPGAPVSTLVYDLLRSTTPGNYMSLGTACLESDDGPGTSATDGAVPAVGQAYFYLVRAQNACPLGQGSLGTDSGGNPRVGRACP